MGGRRVAAALVLAAVAAGAMAWVGAFGRGVAPRVAPGPDELRVGTGDAAPPARAVTRPDDTNGTPKAAIPDESYVTLRVVTDEDGAPIPGAEVEIVRLPADEQLVPVPPDISDADLAPGSRRMTTDEAGTASFRTPAGRELAWVARCEGRFPAAGRAIGGGLEARLAQAESSRVTVVAAETGLPIAGAAVAIVESGIVLDVASTDARGESCIPAWGPRLRRAPGRRTALLVSASGRVARWLDEWPESAVALTAGCALAGVVAAQDGSPVPGATLRLAVIGAPATRSGPDGRFRFDAADPSERTQQIHVAASGYIPRIVEASSGDDDFRIVVSRPVPVPVRVTGAAGPVFLSLSTRSHHDFAECRDTEAPVVLHAAEGETAQIFARSAGEAERSWDAPDRPYRGGAAVAVRFGMPETVVRMEPVPRSYARLRAMNPDLRPDAADGAQVTDAKLSDDSAEVLLEFGAPPGSDCEARVTWHMGGTPVATRVRTHAAIPVDPQIVDVSAAVVRTGLTIEGPADTTLPSDLPLTVLVTVDPEGPMGSWRVHEHALTPAQAGDWRIELDAERPHRVAVQSEGWCADVADFVPARLRDGRVAVRLARGNRIVGRIVDAAGDPAQAMLEAAGATCVADSSGAFSLELNKTAPVTLVARRRGVQGAILRLPLTVPPGATLDLGTIVAASRTFRGQVLDRSGRPASGASLEWSGGRRKDATVPPAGADGRFEISVGAADAGMLLAQKVGHGSAWVAVKDVSSAPESVELRLTEPCEVRLSGSESLSKFLYVRPEGAPDGWFPRWEALAPLASPGQSTCLLVDLPPGRLVVGEYAEGGRRIVVETAPGRVAEADFR